MRVACACCVRPMCRPRAEDRGDCVVERDWFACFDSSGVVAIALVVILRFFALLVARCDSDGGSDSGSGCDSGCDLGCDSGSDLDSGSGTCRHAGFSGFAQ